jgi:hypothetical protein
MPVNIPFATYKSAVNNLFIFLKLMNDALFTAALLICWMSKVNDQRLDTDLVVRLDAEVLLPIACHLITNF